MAQPPDREARVARLETQVHDLEERVRHSQQDAAAARVLAGGADRDVTEMRREIRESRARVDDGFVEMRGKLAAAGQQQIVDLLNTVIAEGGQRSDG